MSNQLFQKISVLYNSKKLPWIIIAIGITLRFVPYLFNRSLWLDESRLALNILDRSFLELTMSLSYQQAAPIGFLMIEKLAVLIFNSSEYALRLFPLLSGIISMFLFYWIAKRFIKSEAVPIAMGLFAISKYLIYYSSEVKQYSSDVLIALLLLYFFMKNIHSKTLTASNITLFGILGAASIWFSHPSVFILASIGVVLILLCIIKKEWTRIGYLSIAYSFWTISFILYYLVSLNSLTSNTVFLKGWSNAFMPFQPSSFTEIRWFFSTFFKIFKNPLGFSLSGIAALAFLVGSISIFLKKKDQFFILILPILFVLLSSAFHKYPFSGRLLLFLVPCLLIFIAEGAEQIINKTMHNMPIIGISFICLLFLHPSLNACYNLAKPRTREEIKPVISYIRNHQRNGDVLYLYYASKHAYKYYSKILNFHKNNYIVGVGSRDNLKNYENDIEKLSGNKRVWLLFSHVHIRNGVNEEKHFLNYLDKIGTRIDAFKAPGASAYLYNLNALK